jgi:hypothetical protein
MSALHQAVRDGRLDEVRRLIVSGKVDINEKDSMKRTALHLACWKGNLEIVKLLLQAKVNVDSLAMDDFTALHFAAQQANTVDIIKELHKKDKNLIKMRVSKGNKTALHLAIAKGDLSVIRCLLELGSDVMSKTGTGQTTLEIAKAEEVFNLVKEFYEGKIKAKAGVIDKQTGLSADGFGIGEEDVMDNTDSLGVSLEHDANGEEELSVKKRKLSSEGDEGTTAIVKFHLKLDDQ